MACRIHVYVSGRVQGVFFRDYAKRKADTLGLKGWVRNLSDGRVEIIVEGDDKVIEPFVDYIRKGSAGSRVDEVDVKKERATGEFKRFDIKY